MQDNRQLLCFHAQDQMLMKLAHMFKINAFYSCASDLCLMKEIIIKTSFLQITIQMHMIYSKQNALISS